MRPVSYDAWGKPITATTRLNTVDRLIAAHDAGKAHSVAISPHGEREWRERRARYLAEREELQQRIAAGDQT